MIRCENGILKLDDFVHAKMMRNMNKLPHVISVHFREFRVVLRLFAVIMVFYFVSSRFFFYSAFSSVENKCQGM